MIHFSRISALVLARGVSLQWDWNFHLDSYGWWIGTVCHTWKTKEPNSAHVPLRQNGGTPRWTQNLVYSTKCVLWALHVCLLLWNNSIMHWIFSWNIQFREELDTHEAVPSYWTTLFCQDQHTENTYSHLTWKKAAHCDYLPDYKTGSQNIVKAH